VTKSKMYGSNSPEVRDSMPLLLMMPSFQCRQVVVSQLPAKPFWTLTSVTGILSKIELGTLQDLISVNTHHKNEYSKSSNFKKIHICHRSYCIAPPGSHNVDIYGTVAAIMKTKHQQFYRNVYISFTRGL